MTFMEFLRSSQKFCPSCKLDCRNFWDPPKANLRRILVFCFDLLKKSNFKWIFEILSKILSQFPLWREMEILLGIWPSRCGAYVSHWSRNHVKRSSPLVDDECCKESERLSVENAQYEHDGICKWYPLLYSKPKTRHITFWGWTIQWSKIGVSHI